MAEEKKNPNIPYEEEKDGIPAPATEPQLSVEYNLFDLFNKLDTDPAETPVNNEEPKGAKQLEFPTEHDDPFADLDPNELFTDEESPKKPEQPVLAPDYSETYPDYAKEKKQGLDYFDEALSAEELAARYINALAMYDDRENVVMNVKGVEMELVKEDCDNTAKEAARINRNQVEDRIEGANVYINGVRKNVDQLVAFIEANKAEFVAACKVAFPDIDERIAKKMREEAEKAEQSRSKKEKKRGLSFLFKRNGKKLEPPTKPTPAAEKKGLSFFFKRNGKKLEPPIELPHEEAGKYVAEAEKKTAEAKNNNVQNTTPHQPTEVQKQVLQPAPEAPSAPEQSTPPMPDFNQRVAEAMIENEMKSVTQFFDSAEKFNSTKKYMQADVYLRDPQTDNVDYTITLKSNGKDKRIIIDGRYWENVLESDLKKLISEYPGQMKPQIDAKIKTMSQSKDGKPRRESPAKE